MPKKLTKWLFFSVLVSLTPLLFNVLILVSKNKTFDLNAILGSGELLLIVAAMCAASIGEVIGSGNRLQIVKIIAGGASVIVLMVSALYFSSIAEAKLSQQPMDADIVSSTSISLFLISCITSSICIAISET
ncbi:hypothetical protein RYZ26_17060 [Terasakiella sp. A23]|uniref:hypothetical protein n=1 Tax=Terasakiella sp. FCG-A23 TaxID=3080561 RepID=UPI0029539595|nr:hypothetical protein [Terasakiella sp. A23]MDV7341322.1 hypothetical protein [Terasakiella sp. A23]